MLVNGKELLKEARNNKYAIAQFNINNLEWAKYILEAAQEENKPIILGVSEGAIKYMGGYNVVVQIIYSLINDLNITIDVVLHLDHGKSIEACFKAIDAGFSSVMYDGSSLPLEENIENTKKVVEYANLKNVFVEAELGGIGTNPKEISYTSIEDARRFVEETNINSFAPAIGSVHGIYKKMPDINNELLINMNKELNTLLVLHGGSGLSDETIRSCIENGICKININTDLQVAWSKKVKKYLLFHLKVYDPRKIISSGEEAIKEKVKKYINLFTNQG